MNKEQVGKLLDDEAFWIQWYEERGLTTSDAQGATSAIMTKRYGLDGLSALNQLDRDEARTLLIEREDK